MLCDPGIREKTDTLHKNLFNLKHLSRTLWVPLVKNTGSVQATGLIVVLQDPLRRMMRTSINGSLDVMVGVVPWWF